MDLKGEYTVIFKHPSHPKDTYKLRSFEGYCENFTPAGKCVFKNSHDQIIVVEYKDLIQVKPK